MLNSCLTYFQNVRVELTSIGQLPAWEQNVEFDGAAVVREVRHDPTWITIGGNLSQDAVFPSAEDVARDGCPAHLHLQLHNRDPEHFVAGQLHDHSDQWQSILNVNDTNDKVQVENWIKNKVYVGEFFQHFKGNFKGYAYDSDTPVTRHFVNSAVCKTFLILSKVKSPKD